MLVAKAKMQIKNTVVVEGSRPTPPSCSPARIDLGTLVMNKPLPASPSENRAPQQTEPLLPAKYVSPIRLLEILFEEESRPSMRWLRAMTAARKIPFTKLGGKVLFRVAEVEAALVRRAAR